MVRPKRMRRVVTCHRHELNRNLKPIELSVDEFEAIRFKDYHNIKQTESAEFMGILPQRPGTCGLCPHQGRYRSSR